LPPADEGVGARQRRGSGGRDEVARLVVEVEVYERALLGGGERGEHVLGDPVVEAGGAGEEGPGGLGVALGGAHEGEAVQRRRERRVLRAEGRLVDGDGPLEGR